MIWPRTRSLAVLIKIYLTFIKLHSCNILRYSSRFFLSWHLCCDFCWKSPRKNLFYRRRSHLGRLPALLHLFGMLPLSFTCLIKHSYLFAYHQPNISTLCISSCDKGQVTNLWTEDKTKFETHPGAAHACRIRRQTCDRSQSQKERVVNEHLPQLRLRSWWVRVRPKMAVGETEFWRPLPLLLIISLLLGNPNNPNFLRPQLSRAIVTKTV